MVEKFSPKDKEFMSEALRLAQSAQGRTTPDPLVGAVLVKNGKIISVGYHGEVRTPHAEAWAIEKAGARARGATLYINLEPCCHFGHNPPCTQKIVAAGIKRVVVGMKDPNPLVSGKGFRYLRRHGVKVQKGLLEEEAQKINEIFSKYITTKLPFVAVKMASTLDGKIATRTGASKWISGVKARKLVHQLRSTYDAILVGIGTVLQDNPRLSSRSGRNSKQPTKIILDRQARLPLSARLLQDKRAKTIVAVGPKAASSKVASLKKAGAHILVFKTVRELLKKLAQEKISSILIEGGPEVVAAVLKAKLVDKVQIIIAPKIFGGREALGPVGGLGVSRPSQADTLKKVEIQKLGQDFMISGYLR